MGLVRRDQLNFASRLSERANAVHVTKRQQRPSVKKPRRSGKSADRRSSRQNAAQSTNGRSGEAALQRSTMSRRSAMGRLLLGGQIVHTWPPSSQRSVGVVIGCPTLFAASPALQLSPIPRGSSRVVPAWGTLQPSPAVQCVEVNTRPAPSIGFSIVSASRCLQD